MKSVKTNVYSVFLDKGLYIAEVTMTSGMTEFMSKALICTGSQFTVISNSTFEKLNYCGEICEEVDIKLPEVLYPIKACRILLDNFKLGTIDLGQQSIMYVPNKKFTDDIIGMDTLNHLYLEHKAMSNCLHIWQM